jgi:Fur family ferric uptake transcriptional regulator
MKQTDEFQYMLRSAGLKSTPARLAVLSFLNGQHFTNAQEIHDAIGKKKDLDLVTIYRTLGSFEKVGLIKRVNLNKDAVCYEFNKGHHHHVICTNCEKVSEFKDPDDGALVARALKEVKDFKSISHHSFDLFGLCNACARK